MQRHDSCGCKVRFKGVHISGRLSPRLTEVTCLLGQAFSFGEASDVLNNVLGVKVSPDSIGDAVNKVGRHLHNEELIEAQNHSFSENTFKSSPDLVYCQADGAHINTRNKPESWKENKLGMVFSAADIKKSGEGENERISIQKKSFVTSLAKGKDDFVARFGSVPFGTDPYSCGAYKFTFILYIEYVKRLN